MGRSAVDVDPRFGEQLRRLRTERGLSLRDLAGKVHHGKSFLHELQSGQKHPPAAVARRLDEALGATGILVALADRPVAPVAGDLDLVRYAAHRPRAADPAAVDALGEILGHLRRLEDTIGSAPVIPAVGAHLRTVEALADEARGAVRTGAVNLAGQWAQFAGWLRAATGQREQARRWYARSLEYAAEAGDDDLVASALSMRGHLAWLARQSGPLIELSAAASRYDTSPGVRALAEQQQARGHALAGDRERVERHLDRAHALAELAAANPDREPRWVYFYSPQYLIVQRGLAYRLLGRHSDAVAQLTAGLAAMPSPLRQSEFVAAYVLHLAAAHHADGNDDEAGRLLDEVRTVASMTASTRLAGDVDQLARRLHR